MIDYDKLKGKQLAVYIKSDKSIHIDGILFSANDDHIIIESKENYIFLYIDEISFTIVSKKQNKNIEPLDDDVDSEESQIDDDIDLEDVALQKAINEQQVKLQKMLALKVMNKNLPKKIKEVDSKYSKNYSNPFIIGK